MNIIRAINITEDFGSMYVLIVQSVSLACVCLIILPTSPLKMLSAGQGARNLVKRGCLLQDSP
jgi:hypothetical protein